MSEDTGARLEKIQGGIELITEKLTSANMLANERHETMRAEIASLKAADEKLDGRVTVLESDKDQRLGERKGIAIGGKMLWAGIGFIPGAIAAAAAILRILG